MKENPPKLGTHWGSSLEIAFRSISWLWSFYFFKDSVSLAPELFAGALKFLYLSARHIETFLSTYFSPNTHRTGEALAKGKLLWISRDGKRLFATTAQHWLHEAEIGEGGKLQWRRAIELARRNGYTATTVDEICTAAGLTKGAFFHHFPSKEALAAERCYREFRHEVEAARKSYETLSLALTGKPLKTISTAVDSGGYTKAGTQGLVAAEEKSQDAGISRPQTSEPQTGEQETKHTTTSNQPHRNVAVGVVVGQLLRELEQPENRPEPALEH
jgi:AcrR family transcriptional regulator